MKNNIIRGVRKASDFLMALQLTGAFKEEALANLQVELPAVVIGGGLTAIDTATELLAYYPLQAEKTLARYEKLVARDAARQGFARSSTARSGRSWTGFSTTARRCAASASAPARPERRPDFARLCQRVGRRLDRLPPLAGGVPGVPAEPRGDHQGPGGGNLLHREPGAGGGRRRRQRASWPPCGFAARRGGDVVELPARTCWVAAGTTPNITYAKE